jgi:hypothetical protein
MATTTNYGWTTPDDTALVKDGAAAIRTLGSSIDTTLKTQIDAQIPDSLLTTKGDLIAATGASTPARLGVGTNDQVLIADSTTATGLKWGTPAAGSMTLLSTTTLTGSSVTISSISQGYKDLFIIIRNFKPIGDAQINVQINADATASRHYSQNGWTVSNGASTASTSILVSGYQDSTGTLGQSIIRIADYTNTVTPKTVYAQSITRNEDTPTNWNFWFGGGFYNQTTAISSLKFAENNTSGFTSGTILLYGVN